MAGDGRKKRGNKGGWCANGNKSSEKKEGSGGGKGACMGGKEEGIGQHERYGMYNDIEIIQTCLLVDGDVEERNRRMDR